jgi:hypothetical protein
MSSKDPESLVQCPYDKIHRIRLKRLPYHLQKCRRNYKGERFLVCPFNARHELPRLEYEHHLVHCEDRHIIEPSLIHFKRLQEDPVYRQTYLSSGYGGDTTQPPPADVHLDCDEDWDTPTPAHSTPRVWKRSDPGSKNQNTVQYDVSKLNVPYMHYTQISSYYR